MRVSVSGHQGHQSITQLIAEAKKHSSQPKVQGGKPTGHPLEQELDQLYISRKSSGNQRLTFNDKLNKFIGLYNEKGSIIVKKEEGLKNYDMFNLTAAARGNSLEKHFGVISNVMKQQLKTEQFDDFGLPVMDLQRLIGRIININPEE